jgi:glycosyltransferase involved in cell wall biosynthesis
MKVNIFAGGVYTTLTARALPLAKVLEKYDVKTEVITPIAWNFFARGKLGNILSIALTYHPMKYVETLTKPVDVVIIRKSSNLQAYLLVKMLKRKNIRIIFDLDDALFLPSGNIFGMKIRPGSFYLERIIKDVDHVTVNGHFLLYYARNFNKNSSIIHDPVDTVMFSPEKKIKDPKKVIIGWEGNARIHRRNLTILIKPLKKIGKEYYNVKFKIISSLGDPIIREMFRPLESVIEIDYGVKQWVPMQTFAKLIYDFDILVSPLENAMWNEGKSALRVGIGMAMGIPVIASPVGEQKYVVKHGVNGFLARNEEEWYNYLKMLIEDEDLRKRIGREGRKTAEKELSLEVNGRKLYEIIMKLVKT